MDPATRLYGIAVAAVARASELERADDIADDFASGFKKELTEAAGELFSGKPADQQQAYILMSRAASTALTGLDMVCGMVTEEHKAHVVDVINATKDLIRRSEAFAGLSELTTETTDTPATA